MSLASPLLDNPVVGERTRSRPPRPGGAPPKVVTGNARGASGRRGKVLPGRRGRGAERSHDRDGSRDCDGRRGRQAPGSPSRSGAMAPGEATIATDCGVVTAYEVARGPGRSSTIGA